MLNSTNKFIATLVLPLVLLLSFTHPLLAATPDVIESVESNADAGDSVVNPPSLSQLPAQLVAEKTVTFYTSYGYQLGENWHIPIKLWVSEQPDTARRLLGKAARRGIRNKAGVKKLNDAQQSRYENRIEDFIADSESREKVSIAFDDDPLNKHYLLSDKQGNSKTDRNGNLHGNLVLSEKRAKTLLESQNANNGWLSFSAVSNDHAGTGYVRLVSPTGTSVISDIDDTIKDTGITRGHDVVLRNTFFETFKQVPCMSDYYATFDDGVAFHYVSGAPWQLYRPLVDFMVKADGGYPRGSLHMKNVRTNLSDAKSYKDISKLIKQGSKQVTFNQKIAQITQLITHFPHRQFVLIGDSGERDPEVFAQIRKRFPTHINRIIIRDIDNQHDQNKRRYSNMSIIAGDANQANGCAGLGSLMQ